jgi:nucleoside-diphosphate kinase
MGEDDRKTKKIQQTLVVIKPDGLKKSLTGNILTRLSETRLRIVGAKVVCVSRELAEKHYAHLKEKKGEEIFEATIKYLQGQLHGDDYKRVLALVYEGENAIEKVRKIAGATNPEKAEPTSIRGQYGRITSDGVFENVLHCSENEEEAEREIKLWFEPDEIVDTIYPVEEVEVTVKKKKWK